MTKNSELGFEDKLWESADTLRGNMDASQYKHYVLGLIFLKYVSDSFEERRKWLERAIQGDFEGMDEKEKEEAMDYYVENSDDEYTKAILEEKGEYLSKNIFWVPEKARWNYIESNASQPDIGKILDDALAAIEKENPKQLKGILPKIYASSPLDSYKMSKLIQIIGSIGLGDSESRSKDILGRVYEYFIGKFAEKEGKGGGEFYTPRPIVRLLVEMIEPYKGRVYDPCSGSGGMFVQSAKFIEAHGGKKEDISVYGQESNPGTFKICKMNLALRGIEGNIKFGDTLLNDMHRNLRADYILANPPFNQKKWGAERVEDDIRWKYGTPPKGNANYAWIQHMIYHLGPKGIAGFVLANGSLSAGGKEGEIRQKIIEDDIVDCIIALPGQLFYSTPIPASLWFVNKDKKRKGGVLFIDARKMGVMKDRTHKELTDEEIERIARTYHAWRGEEGAGEYEDIEGFCRSASMEEIKEYGYVLNPGRYVGTEEEEDDGIPFEEKMDRLVKELAEQFRRSRELEEEIKSNLRGLEYEL